MAGRTPRRIRTASTAYLYDGAGQRVQRVVTSGGTTTTTSSIGDQEEVTTSGGTTITTTYYGSLAESVNGALSYLLSDGLSCEAVNANSGQRVDGSGACQVCAARG